MVIPKHFIPPMAVNAVLGTVLWTTYGEASTALDPYIGHHPTATAALSGAFAGGAQALVAAPAENARLLLEGGTVYHSWSHAWKETMEEARQVRSWMKDVGDMAGRGWDGWGWGLAKDMCGFAVFFSIFEVTRRSALFVKDYTKTMAATEPGLEQASDKHREKFVGHLPRTFHGITLVTGGVVAGLAFELVGRPWDVARRTVELHRLAVPRSTSAKTPTWHIVWNKFRDEGLMHFFHNPSGAEHIHAPSGGQRRLYTVLRTLGRAGPWGVGFLVWEMYNS
ncbi:hypothetical protein CPB85DRAFT_1278680 [Mucidula mucida]|nr:hypothetical protein CPB85DRAFT_1278680 [Mucidula mucida]